MTKEGKQRARSGGTEHMLKRKSGWQPQRLLLRGHPANSKSSPAYAEQPSRSRPRLRDSFKVSSWSKKQKE